VNWAAVISIPSRRGNANTNTPEGEQGLQVTDNQNDYPAQYQIGNHLIAVTMFPNFAAKTLETWDMTLDGIGAEILAENRKRKNLLPWLKLAEFGDVKTAKGSLRHDANVLKISGVEIDSDSGRPFAEAVALLKAAGIRALVYTSPSHMIPDEDGTVKEKWRVLAPTSVQLEPSERAQLTARLNGVLKGAAAAESFVLSQSYYYGAVDRNPAHAVEIVDGAFIDLCDDLDAGAIDSPGPAAKKRKQKAKATPDATPSYSDADIAQLVEDAIKISDDGENQWHTNMRTVTASLVGKGRSDAEIHEICEPGYGDDRGYDDVQKLIDTARAKFDMPNPDEVDTEFEELMRGVEADAAEAGLPPFRAAEVKAQHKYKKEDFYAFLRTHHYIYKHTGELWVAVSINSVLPRVVVGHKMVPDPDGGPPIRVDITISPSAWLDRHASVAQMTWAPGLPQLVEGKLTFEGGWVAKEGATVFNLYRPPVRVAGDAAAAAAWVDFIRDVYPDHVEHILDFMAHRIQKPHEKINHCLVLTGSPGIGKDTMLEPLKYGVGAWNFAEISPQDLTSNNNGFMKSVVLRISEARDSGEVDRYKMYEKMKTVTAAPPDMTYINIKYVPQFWVVNVTGAIVTTNYPTDGLYLPPDDRRHYVCGTEAKKDDFDPDYWTTLWTWYRRGGLAAVVAFLAARDISGFDAKKPPEKTAAFWRMVDGGQASEIPELRDALDKLGQRQKDGSVVLPTAITLEMVIGACASDESGLYSWLKDRANRRAVPHRMETCGYTPVRNPDADDGLWKIGGKRQAAYGLMSTDMPTRIAATTALAVGSRTKGTKV